MKSMKRSLYWLIPALMCQVLAAAFATEVEPLSTRALPALDASEELMLTVEYAPGEQSAPHRHNAHVFVYVLEGTVEMQVDGGDLQLLRPGETFYEAPDDVHRVSRNASDSEPAKIVVFFIKAPDAPVSVPVEDGEER